MESKRKIVAWVIFKIPFSLCKAELPKVVCRALDRGLDDGDLVGFSFPWDPRAIPQIGSEVELLGQFGMFEHGAVKEVIYRKNEEMDLEVFIHIGQPDEFPVTLGDLRAAASVGARFGRWANWPIKNVLPKTKKK
jgi:hypothetical protein